MNKNNMTVAGSALAGSYVSPEAKVTEIQIEGVLCESPVDGGLSVNPWEDGTFEGWDK